MQTHSDWRNVALISLCQALAFSVTSMQIFVGSLIGHELASDPSWATLPVAAMVVGTASLVVPLTLAMQRLGRRKVSAFAMLAAAASALLSAWSIEQRSFVGFCLGMGGTGVAMAALAQFRFWAMESVLPERMPTAAAAVLIGGVAAAMLGPQLALWGNALTATAFVGAFLLAACLLISVALLVMTTRDIPVAALATTEPARPLSAMLASRWFWTALITGTVAYAVMTTLMTATPLSMHHGQGHSLEDTKWVIQSHIIAMFLPSLITPLLAQRVGLPGTILLGVLLYGLTIGFALSDSSVTGYWSALVMLGLGWNLLFLAGTSLLPQTHLPSERFRAQAFNDGFVFTTQALASLGAGALLHWLGWQALLWICLPVALLPMALLLYARAKPMMAAS